jgi:hypothetical protein
MMSGKNYAEKHVELPDEFPETGTAFVLMAGVRRTHDI